MWNHFSERARRVVFKAQEEAQDVGEGYVSTEHLLLGLVSDADSAACRYLTTECNLPLNVIRETVLKQLPRGDSRPSQDMTLTPRAKRVIDLAQDESKQMSDTYIGTEHLLLGLIREGDGLAGRVLATLKLELPAVRKGIKLFQEAFRNENPTEAEPYPMGWVGETCEFPEEMAVVMAITDIRNETIAKIDAVLDAAKKDIIAIIQKHR